MVGFKSPAFSLESPTPSVIQLGSVEVGLCICGGLEPDTVAPEGVSIVETAIFAPAKESLIIAGGLGCALRCCREGSRRATGGQSRLMRVCAEQAMSTDLSARVFFQRTSSKEEPKGLSWTVGAKDGRRSGEGWIRKEAENRDCRTGKIPPHYRARAAQASGEG